jgi:hypothetical protein
MNEDEVTAKPPSVAVYRVLAADCDDVAHDHNCNIFSWVSSVLTQPPAKRASAYALINCLGNCDRLDPYVYSTRKSCTSTMVSELVRV